MDSHRWAAAIAVDAGSIPGDFASQCGSGSEASLGAGLSVLFRPRRWLVTAFDTRATGTLEGCKLFLPAPVQIGPNMYENWAAKQYPGGVPAEPLVRSALHVGVELPPGAPPLRVSVGAGVIWTGHQTPFAALAIGGGSNGRGARFFWELETNICRIHVTEVHTRYRIDSTSMEPVPLPSRTASYIAHPRSTVLHLGMEVPLA
jgi:hypothetical protein